jgi:hypothetical protein
VNRDPTRSSPLSLSLSVARGLYHNPPSAANRLTHHEDLPRRGEYRSTVVGAGREHATGAESGAASYGVFARSETQRLNVPYFVLNAATPAFRSVTHILPAATVACCCACDLADAFVETHLPYASAVEP